MLHICDFLDYIMKKTYPTSKGNFSTHEIALRFLEIGFSIPAYKFYLASSYHIKYVHHLDSYKIFRYIGK